MSHHRWRAWIVLLGLGALLLARPAPAGTHGYAADSLTSRKYASAPIAITADGATLLVVQPDSNSLSLVDLDAAYTVTDWCVAYLPLVGWRGE